MLGESGYVMEETRTDRERLEHALFMIRYADDEYHHMVLAIQHPSGHVGLESHHGTTAIEKKLEYVIGAYDEQLVMKVNNSIRIDGVLLVRDNRTKVERRKSK
jgi:hypothetical protein